MHARVKVDSRLYDGTMEVVSGDHPRQAQTSEIVVVAHLCHPIPSANDNASGAAAALEAARALQSLVSSGQLPAPKRTIRFLWLPEMTGSCAYLAGREDDLDQMVAGINLDMVGEDQNQTGSSWLIERPPEAAASFAPDLLARLRDEFPKMKGMTGVSPSHTGMGAYPLYRQAEVPFSGGSDHFILSDPAVGVPTPDAHPVARPLLPHLGRYARPHRSPQPGPLRDPGGGLRLLAGQRPALRRRPGWATRWLARFKARVVETAQTAVTEAQDRADGESLARIILDLDRRLAYLLDRQKAALATLERLAPVRLPGRRAPGRSRTGCTARTGLGQGRRGPTRGHSGPRPPAHHPAPRDS